jgi:hypothetical protein
MRIVGWHAGPFEPVLERVVHVDGTLELEVGAEPLLQLTGLRIDSPPWAETPNQLQIARARIQIRRLVGV